MKLLFLNRWYWPDHAATAQQLTDLAEQLAAAGHEVEVLSSRRSYRGEAAPLPRSEEHAGVLIRRLRGLGPGGRLRRALDYAFFHLQAALHLLLHGRDARVVIALTDPPALGLHGLALRLITFGRVKSVVWCMDLLADAAEALGVVEPGSPTARLAHAPERLSLRGANAVVALGPCMRRRLEGHGVRPERIHEIGVWADGQEVPATEPGSGALRAELGLEGRFVVMYSGNAGLVHDFDSTLEAMKRLRDHERVRFVFAGGGPRLPELKAAVRSAGLENVRFLPYFPREHLGEALGLADAHLVTLRRGMEGVVVPCKLSGALAAGRPILAVSPEGSTVARTVRGAGAGFALAPEDAEGLVAAIRRLAAEPSLARAMGLRARRAFEEEHEKELLTRRWQALLSLTAAR